VSGDLFAVVSGGGTGGHVFEAVAIARALERRGHEPSTIELVGSRRGQEASLLEGEPFPFTLLPGRGLVRRLDADAVRANLEALAGLTWAAGRQVLTMARRRPKVVVSVGGYASFPADLAAVVTGVPLVLVTIDAVPGLVHRTFARLAAANAVAFGGTALPGAVVTGVAVRPQIAAVERTPDAAAAGRASLGLPGARSTVGVVGGSLGARRLNTAAADLSACWADRVDRSVFHVTGRRNWDETLSVLRRRDGATRGGSRTGGGAGGGLAYRMVPFEADMASLYAAADVMVCRAGASTVAELTVTGTPAVLVPLPGAPGDHQQANARALVAAGAAVVLRDEDCTGERLAAVLDELLGEPAGLERMAKAARSLGRPDAADRIAELVESRAR
jgi:UDP-N-acetylglucosamine--N-acetylmuramyl-(pentapeptide) pyrophosphoryl-undecaprenol N-acetylglucosamine transferase